jgi:hypothetical protein
MNHNAHVELTDQELKTAHDVLCSWWNEHPNDPRGEHIDSLIDKLRSGAIASCPVYHCDHCGDTYEPVRKLPHGGGMEGHMVVCKWHYEKEIDRREAVNEDLQDSTLEPLPTPAWEDLEIVEGKLLSDK